jgi:membrane-bound serine protease (ClpP class)
MRFVIHGGQPKSEGTTRAVVVAGRRRRRKMVDRTPGAVLMAVAVGALCVLLVAAVGLLRPATAATTAAAAADGLGGTGQAIVVDFDVPVDPGSSSLMARALTAATSTNASAIVIEMNTPGGYLSDMTNIISIIGQANQSGIPTFTYVPPNALAASAGSYIAMASNRILMGTGSEIGPSTPIVEGGTDLQQNHTEDAMISLMVSLADKWGRNTTAAYQMVYSDQAFSSTDAIADHIADGNASTLQGALTQLGLKGGYTLLQESAYDQLLSALSNANLSGLLILLGGLAIVLDLYHPTFVLTFVGAVALVAGLVGLEVVGASILGVVVIFAGVGLMFLELRLGHGLAMVGGGLLGAVGILFLLQGVQFSTSAVNDYTQVEAVGIVAVGILAGAYIRWIVGPLRKKGSMTGEEALVGKRGVTVSQLSPVGEVRVEGVIWKARSLSGFVPAGAPVIVKAVEGIALSVENVIEESESGGAEQGDGTAGNDGAGGGRGRGG